MTKVSYIIYYGLELGILAPAQVKWSNYRLIIPNEYNEGKKGSRRYYVDEMLGYMELLLIPHCHKVIHTQTQT